MRAEAPAQVTHESLLPDSRVQAWRPAEAEAAVIKRRLAHWRARGGALAGDVNYAHLPRAAAFLEAAPELKIVVVKRERAATVKSFAAWTEPGGAEGSLRPRDHWRAHTCGDWQSWAASLDAL